MTRSPFRVLAAAVRGGRRRRHRRRRAAPAVRARQPGDAAQAQSRRLAHVQPHLRRATVQSAQADQPAERRSAQGSVQEGAGQRAAREHPDRLPRRDVSAAAGRQHPGAWTRPPARSSGSTAGRAAPRAPRRIAIYDDMVYYTSPDGFIVALDARTGEVRWETKSSGGMVSGVIVVEGKVISGRSCSPSRDNCYIAAHDAKTGAELWRFYTAAGSNEPGGDTWAGAPDATRAASTWGLPGGYDPVKRLVYWGVANPTPNTRANRHGGNYDAIGYTAPIDLYSNSTIALNPDTGKLVVVLPAPAGRRLGRGLPARADAAAHRGESRPEVRQVDQPRREEGRAARRRAHGGRGRRHLRARPRHRPVPVGEPVPVRHARLPDLEHRRQDRAGARSTRTSRSADRRTARSSATGTRAATGRRPTTPAATRCSSPTSRTAST